MCTADFSIVTSLERAVKMRADERPSVGTLHITVMGSSQVGKSALTVRYLTKRFIGEYRSDSGEHLKNV